MKGDTPQDELYKKETGENLRRLRLEKKLTQEELAHEMSERFGKAYTANNISLFEKGRDHMHIGAIFDFVTFFGVSLSEIAPSRWLRITGNCPKAEKRRSEPSSDFCWSIRTPSPWSLRRRKAEKRPSSEPFCQRVKPQSKGFAEQ